MEESEEELYEKAIRIDHKNVNNAIDGLIESVSKFKAADRIDELTADDYAEMLVDLDLVRFMISGVMYLHGIPICGHMHEDEEDDD